MRFHPKGLLALVVFLALVALGIDLRWGIAAILAMTALDALSLLAPFFHSSRDRRSD